jgi:hypothetical protein
METVGMRRGKRGRDTEAETERRKGTVERQQGRNRGTDSGELHRGKGTDTESQRDRWKEKDGEGNRGK